MSRIYEITERVASYAPRADLDLINRAYVFASQAHGDQRRRSGEMYIIHPLAVASILASLKLDTATIVTGLLHDTVEDTHVSLEVIAERFGEDVAHLVDGVTKIGQIKFRSSEHKQAENFRKMLLATAQDLRVLLVKLADRLHNMRTLGFVPEHKRRQVSEETMQLYAPLAHRLGMHWIKQEMEDISFSYLEPEAYQELVGRVHDKLEFLNQTRSHLESILQEALHRQGVNAKVYGRMKHLYSIHDKMQRKHVDFGDLYDLVAFRIIVDDAPTCYQVLGMIHGLYRPVPGRFKDYIALPKPNGYQSLHTSVIGPDNHRIEVQIRTEAMHRYAEDGIAAHWAYKDDGKTRDMKTFQWLKQMADMIQETENPGEFLENMRLDLFIQEVYVFSPNGDIYALPRGARPLDFAYAVHTDVGNHCVAVRINGELADFQARLRNGDQIEVVTSPEQTPSRQWLRYVRTPRARQGIRQWFRRQERELSIKMGGQILQEVFGRRSVPEEILAQFDCRQVDDLKMRLGHGDLPLESLIHAVNQDGRKPIRLGRFGATMVEAASCCHPIPGDPVLGQIESGKGMIIHHRNCAKVPEDTRDHWMEINWQPEEDKSYPTGIEIMNENKRGMLAALSTNIANAGANIEDIRIEQRAGALTRMQMLVDVRDRKHLAGVIRAIKAADGVVTVKRRNQVGLGEKQEARGFGAAFKSLLGRGKGLIRSQDTVEEKK